MPRLFEVEQETRSQPSLTYRHTEVKKTAQKLIFCNEKCKMLCFLVRSLIYPVSVTLGTDTLLKLVEKVNWKIMLHEVASNSLIGKVHLSLYRDGMLQAVN